MQVENKFYDCLRKKLINEIKSDEGDINGHIIKAKHYLGKHLSDERKSIPQNLFICVFYQDEITWNFQEMIDQYNSYKRK